MTAESNIEDIIERLPVTAGVYIMKDSKGKVIYVGKAVNLRTRVRSYFRDSGDQRYSVQFLRNKVADIEAITTETEKEALLLENLLIKKHQPRYNIRLRDDKTYISLRLDTHHEWPRIHRIRKKREGDKAKYFGPFSSSKSVKETMRFIQKLFPLRSCPDHVLKNRSRPCILHQIDRCCAPCVDLVDQETYQQYVNETMLFFEGKREEVVNLLREKMQEYSEDLQFEKAASVRDKIQAIEKTIEKEQVVSHKEFDRDVIANVRRSGNVVFSILQFRDGNLVDSNFYHHKDTGLPDDSLLDEFLSQVYVASNDVPKEIVLPILPSDKDLYTRLLSELRGNQVALLIPQRGDKLSLVKMAQRNAEQEFERRLAGEKQQIEILENLQKKLRLPELPRLIECFDISNLQGSFVVGSMTFFRDGKPDKNGYRRFRVRSVDGQNDFASMKEVLTRRYSRAIKEEQTLPDLVVIDGGKGQLNIAVEVFRELELLGKVPLCGLAKARWKEQAADGEKYRTEERVFLPNRKLPIRFDQSDPALFILTQIRDEAHRFGITYHRSLRSRSSLRSGLEDIPGVGEKRRKILLSHFRSLARLRKASLEQIEEVPGIPKETARNVFQYLHENSLSKGEVEDSADKNIPADEPPES